MYKQVEQYSLGKGIVCRIQKHVDVGVYVGTCNAQVVCLPNAYPVVEPANARTTPGSYIKVCDELKQWACAISSVINGPLYQKMA